LVLLTGPIGFVIYFVYNRDTIALAGSRLQKKNLLESLESKVPPRREPEREDRSYLSLPPDILIIDPSQGGDSSLVGDSSFTDPELDSLIENGKIIDAHEHLQRVLKLAQDMGDTEFAHKYDGYEVRIKRMENLK
jgi:hypothetical protein